MPPAGRRDLRHSGMYAERGNSVVLPTSGKLTVRKADRTAERGRWRKQTLLCNGADKGNCPRRKRADFHLVFYDEKVWQTEEGSKADGSKHTCSDRNGCWCGFPRRNGLGFYGLERSLPKRVSAPDAYRQGDEGKEMGPGASEAPALNPLVERQSPCCTTRDGKPGAKNARCGRRNLDHAKSESTSHPRIATKGVSSQTAQTGLHPKKLREDASTLDSLHEGPSHASPVSAGPGPHCRGHQ